MVQRSPFNGAALEAARRAKKMSRAAFAKAIVEKNNRLQVDGQKVYRWESGTRPEQQFLGPIEEILGCNLRDFFNPGRPQSLRVAVSPYPDFAFLSFCLSEELSQYARHELPDEDRAIETQEVLLDYKDIVNGLCRGPSEGGAVDVALWNETTWERLLKSNPSLRTAIWTSASLIRFRGFALLVSDATDFGLRVFAQQHFDTGRQRIQSREERLRISLRQTLLQLCPTNGKLFEVLVPTGTEMQEVFRLLIEEALPGSLATEQTKLESLLEKVIESSQSDQLAFDNFCGCIARRIPAVYLGGLAHRLLAEQQGALPLIGESSMSLLTELNTDGIRNLTHPGIVLLVRQSTLDSSPDLLNTFERRWNLTVNRLYHDRAFQSIVSRFVAAQLAKWMEAGPARTDASKTLPTFVSHRLRDSKFAEIVQHNLEAFLPWPSPQVT